MRVRDRNTDRLKRIDTRQTETKLAQHDSGHCLGSGALFASVAVVETAGTFTSMTLYNSVYEATVAHMRGAVFFVMAGLALVAMGPVL